MGSICPGQGVVAFAQPLTKGTSMTHKLEMASPIIIEPSQSFFTDYNLHSKPLAISPYSEVTLCQKVSNKKSRIVKIIPKALLPSAVINDRVIFSLFTEIKRLKHSKLVKLYQVYESKDSFYVVSKFFSQGSLVDLVEEGTLNEEKARTVVQQIMILADFLQRQGLDFLLQVNPENILIENADLKVVVNLLHGRILMNEDWNVGIKSAAGRQARDRRTSSELGLLTWFLLTGQRVPRGSDLTKTEPWKSLSAECKDFLLKSVHPSISLQELKSHQWLIESKTSKDV